MVEVRISKARVLVLALILATVLPAFTWWMLDGVRTPEAFQALQIAKDGDRRCLLCGMSYGPYLSLTFVIVGAFDILFGAAAVVGLLRAFGPPTLLITAQGTGRYVLPWRTRTFRIAPGATITVANSGMGLSLEAYVKNMMDEEVLTDTYLTDDSSGLFRNGFYGEPRTYGVSITKTF